MFNFDRFKRSLVEEGILNAEDDKFKDNISDYVRGIVKFRNLKTGELIHTEENLVLMRTRVWIMERLFGTNIPSNYTADSTPGRTIGLFSVGSGGADVNNAPFSPYTVKFSDKDLQRPVPFVIENPDKENSDVTANNPSVVEKLTDDQKAKYFISREKEDGTVSYYGKRFQNATVDKPLGDSKGWIIDNEDGSVAFSLKMTVTPDECRGQIINELGLWLTKYDSSKKDFVGTELATRLTFDSRSLKNISDGLDIEYIIYI